MEKIEVVTIGAFALSLIFLFFANHRISKKIKERKQGGGGVDI